MRAAAVGSGSRAIASAIGIALLAVRLAAQAAAPPIGPLDDLLSDLALRIAASVAPETFVSLEPSTDDDMRQRITEQLAARGVRIAEPAAGRPSLRVRCDDNLREHVCSAEVSGASRSVMVVARPRTAASAQEQGGVLQLRPMVSLREPILDLAVDGDRMLVLTPTAVVNFHEDDGQWRREESRPIPAARVWPRDLRGRFRVSGDRFEAFLPGLTCTGEVDRLPMTCAESSDPWPVPIAGLRLEPTRNYFRMPDGPPVFAMAPLGADAGARWLVAGVDGALAFVDESGQRSATTMSGDDVVAIAAGCAPSHVVVAEPSAERDGDRLTMFSVVRRRLLPAGSPVRLSGPLTALWPMAGRDGATVVTYDQDAGRYDAHHLTVACPR